MEAAVCRSVDKQQEHHSVNLAAKRKFTHWKQLTCCTNFYFLFPILLEIEKKKEENFENLMTCGSGLVGGLLAAGGLCGALETELVEYPSRRSGGGGGGGGGPDVIKFDATEGV